jgi:hypothetical protein
MARSSSLDECSRPLLLLHLLQRGRTIDPAYTSPFVRHGNGSPTIQFPEGHAPGQQGSRYLCCQTGGTWPVSLAPIQACVDAAH